MLSEVEVLKLSLEIVDNTVEELLAVVRDASKHIELMSEVVGSFLIAAEEGHPVSVEVRDAVRDILEATARMRLHLDQIAAESKRRADMTPQ